MTHGIKRPEPKNLGSGSFPSVKTDKEGELKDKAFTTFINDVTRRLNKVTKKMEQIDVDLVHMTPENILNLRSNKLYFKAYG